MGCRRRTQEKIAQTTSELQRAVGDLPSWLKTYPLEFPAHERTRDPLLRLNSPLCQCVRKARYSARSEAGAPDAFARCELKVSVVVVARAPELELAVTTGKFLVLASGTADLTDRARAVLGVTDTAQVTAPPAA